MKKTFLLSSFALLLYIFSAVPAFAATESIAIVRENCALKSIPTANCYTSLSAWEAGEHRDLVASDEIAIAQIEGPWANPDTTPVVIDGWKTDATHYIKIYTTGAARHSGKWDDTKYRLEVGHTTAIKSMEEYVRIDGLQISMNLNYQSSKVGLLIIPQSTPAEVRVSNNIIKEITNYALAGIDAHYLTGSQLWTLKAWNNIVYGFGSSNGRGIYLSGDNWTNYVYNNTVYDNTTGIEASSLSTTILKNNISSNNTTDYVGTFNSSSDYNTSSDATAPGTNSKINQTVSFISKT
ncbi:hypothetical protein MNBD_CPR01-34 [hydrothermal vent metagenome]|uniref:Right handed beta helix domain-containing protein n=1 Tax=hydrothermal vent metagenome TaxID=652676 RepID=A0A3B0US27_9ZZZZ